MKFSTKASYGLRAIANLANSARRPKTLKNISLEEDVSFKYLEQIFRLLKRRGFVSGIRGTRGGYILVKNPEYISVREIIEALDGPLVAPRCVRGNCKKIKGCATSRIWFKLNQEMSQAMESIKLADLIK